MISSQLLLLLTAAISTVHCSADLGHAKHALRSAKFSRAPVIVVSATSEDASGPIPESFVAFSIETSSFPDFAGNLSQPNHFSNNLLDNLKTFQGTKPYVRAGGNTQDYAIYNASLTTAINGTVIPERSPDYPYILYIGPSYFESYLTFPDVKFIHGFNLGKNDTESRARLLESVPVACKALSNGNLLHWQIGNEPDLFNVSAQGPVRPRNYSEVDYVTEWRNLSTSIMDIVRDECPGIATDEWYAPSLAGISTNRLSMLRIFEAGLADEKKLVYIDNHNYIDGATVPGVTLRRTLMNHTRTMSSVNQHTALMRNLSSYSIPYILGEANSLYNQGTPGLSNSFGAALWGVDFNLYAASQNIKRVHMHMGTNYRYASWQPIETDLAEIGTKTPYYGNIAVAAALGNLKTAETQVQHLPLGSETDVAYATYAGGVLQRVTAINLQQYNYTGNEANLTSRGNAMYDFSLPSSCSGQGIVQRLIANGSDAITGVTFNGVSYNWDLDLGKPVVLNNVTRDEDITIVDDGQLSLSVPWSSAAIVQLDCGGTAPVLQSVQTSGATRGRR